MPICGKNRKVGNKPTGECEVLLFISHFGGFCDLLLNRCIATRNLCLFYVIKESKKLMTTPKDLSSTLDHI